MQRCVEIDSNEEVEYIFPEHFPNEPFFSVFYRCLCGKEVLIVPMTVNRYMARGLQDLDDPNDQHRNWAVSNRRNQNHIYPESCNNYSIDCGRQCQNAENYENEENGNQARDEADNNNNNQDGGDQNEDSGDSQENPEQEPENNLPEPRRLVGFNDRRLQKKEESEESGIETDEDSDEYSDAEQ